MTTKGTYKGIKFESKLISGSKKSIGTYEVKINGFDLDHCESNVTYLRIERLVKNLVDAELEDGVEVVCSYLAN